VCRALIQYIAAGRNGLQLVAYVFGTSAAPSSTNFPPEPTIVGRAHAALAIFRCEKAQQMLRFVISRHAISKSHLCLPVAE
jgi:hypothetical protein